MCSIDNYRDLVFAALPSLQILDGKDRDGESFYSDFDDGEEGELDMEDQAELDEILKNLDPETKKRFEAGELSMDELAALGLAGGDYDDEFDFGEGGESEQSEDEGEGNANKRQKGDE